MSMINSYLYPDLVNLWVNAFIDVTFFTTIQSAQYIWMIIKTKILKTSRHSSHCFSEKSFLVCFIHFKLQWAQQQYTQVNDEWMLPLKYAFLWQNLHSCVETIHHKICKFQKPCHSEPKLFPICGPYLWLLRFKSAIWLQSRSFWQWQNRHQFWQRVEKIQVWHSKEELLHRYHCWVVITSVIAITKCYLKYPGRSQGIISFFLAPAFLSFFSFSDCAEGLKKNEKKTTHWNTVSITQNFMKDASLPLEIKTKS